MEGVQWVLASKQSVDEKLIEAFWHVAKTRAFTEILPDARARDVCKFIFREGRNGWQNSFGYNESKYLVNARTVLKSNRNLYSDYIETDVQHTPTGRVMIALPREKEGVITDAYEMATRSMKNGKYVTMYSQAWNFRGRREGRPTDTVVVKNMVVEKVTATHYVLALQNVNRNDGVSVKRPNVPNDFFGNPLAIKRAKP